MVPDIFEDVKEFARVAESPHLISTSLHSVLTLCKRLIEEEAGETIRDMTTYMNSPSLENLVQAVDGAIDTIYVCAFFLNQMGIDGPAHWDAVQTTNMAKFPGGVAVKDAGGKVVKPAGWQPPDGKHLELLIEWNSKMHGQVYKDGIAQHKET